MPLFQVLVKAECIRSFKIEEKDFDAAESRVLSLLPCEAEAESFFWDLVDGSAWVYDIEEIGEDEDA